VQLELRFVSPRESLDAFVELELLASAPYVDFVYEDRDLARRIHRRLVDHDVGEFATPHGVLALDATGEAVGMYAGPLDSTELSRARLRAAAALMKDADFAADPLIRQRASRARAALLQPQAGDAYLSRIAVAPSARGRGIGRALLIRFLADCARRGAQRAILEVSPRHEEALSMYQRAGFEQVGEASASADERVLTYRHLVKSLG
jgi:ribosomal protein S18 acetylase RimI-like enzyme